MMTIYPLCSAENCEVIYMTLDEVFDIMNGREYLNELTDAEEDEMKKSGIVAVFGYSDDNVELRGAVNDELGAFDGAEFYMTQDGLFECTCEHPCKLYREALQKAKKVTAIFDSGWRFETDIPHIEYSINEDGELFCKGIAFFLRECGA
jgi:hypothetical protein